MQATKPTWKQLTLQATWFAMLAAFIGYFSNSPTYTHLAPTDATVKISLVHAGQLVGACRDRTAEELQNLPPNMRAPQICPRERSPLQLEVIVNGKPVVNEMLQPKGVNRDGRAAFYRRITVPSGAVSVAVRMKDSASTDDYDYQAEYSTTLAAADVLQWW